MLIRAKAPLRVSFAGGSTDISPFMDIEGGVVLSATISRYVFGTIRPREDGLIRIDSGDLGSSVTFEANLDPPQAPGFDLIMAAIQRMSPEPGGGYTLALQSGVKPGTGLGSSSALMVVLVGLLGRYASLTLTPNETARLAYQIERKDLAIEGGIQDHYAATFGGLNLLECRDEVRVHRLPLSASIRHELEQRLLLCYTGRARNSAPLMRDQIHRMHSGDVRTIEALRTQKRLALRMRDALLAGQLCRFGLLLDEAWQEKKKVSPLISTPWIDEVYDAALENGALGGKVTGAGGGGYLMFCCDVGNRPKVAQALQRYGMTIVDFALTEGGLSLWQEQHR